MKAFPQFTRDYIRKEISYINLIGLLKCIPPYRGLENKEENGKTTAKGQKKKSEHKSKEDYIHFEQIRF